ncbi:hypothetical protein FHT40_004093 [Mycolicibacterium sp. BK556]|uniref:SAM-dependent methyltransferase n=1 Tax=unclassified Mycolicibacterium TaxID=2636767 RepID=UPI00161E7A3A|nr:hypothetical protein [Mycolicibacterium sp. BK556]MBB3634872.1 hypothetical protein [Mycolicibacterium sp. BK607]
MTLPDKYFDDLYDGSSDPWQLSSRWYERRKYAITMALLPDDRYRHAFEPGCSVGVLTEQLTTRCDHVTATDIAEAALRQADLRLRQCGRREAATLLRQSFDMPWPAADFDLVVISEIAYYFDSSSLRSILDRELPRLGAHVTVVAAHWRHAVADYPQSGDSANTVIGATAGLHRLGGYRDDDVVIDVFGTGTTQSVAARTGVPGAQ